jgi:hypothetical protein
LKSRFKYFWALWAKSIGDKASHDESEADLVAIIRTVVLFIYIITNFFIVAGVIRHWRE